MFVAISESLHQLPRPAKNLASAQPSTLGDDLTQILAVDEIHYQIGVAVFFEVISDARHIGVAELCQQSRFLPELLTKLRHRSPLSARIGHQLLECAGDVKSEVHRLVDSAHAALTQQGDDTVATVDYLSWDEGHRNSYIQIRLQGGVALSARGSGKCL